MIKLYHLQVIIVVLGEIHIEKIYDVTESGEQVELHFNKFVMMTDSDGKLVVDLISSHPESPDMTLCIEEAPSDANRYFNILPGAANLVFIKVAKRK